MSENRIRRQATGLGYQVHKARNGGYILSDVHLNCVILGADFDASLVDIANYFSL